VKRRALACLLGGVLLVAAGCASDQKEVESQVDFHYRLGMAHLQDNNPQAALVEFREALKEDKNAAKVNFAMGHSYFLLDDEQNAEKSMQKVLKVEPDNGEAINYLGNIYEKEGRLDDAVTQFKKAAASTTYMTPHFAYRNLGRVYREKKEDALAEEALKTAVKRVPEYFPARADLAKLYMDQSRWDEAIQEWKTLLDLAPEVADAHFYLGQSYLGKGDAVNAKQEIAAFVLQADKGHPLLPKAKELLQKLGDQN
jgi:type IV pilus biogenesis/stability protein PilW